MRGRAIIHTRLTRYAEGAHTPIQEGEVLDRDTVLKDRYIPLGKTTPATPWARRRRGRRAKHTFRTRREKFRTT